MAARSSAADAGKLPGDTVDLSRAPLLVGGRPPPFRSNDRTDGCMQAATRVGVGSGHLEHSRTRHRGEEEAKNTRSVRAAAGTNPRLQHDSGLEPKWLRTISVFRDLVCGIT